MAAVGTEPVIVVHGGSGARGEHDPAADRQRGEALRLAVEAARAILLAGEGAVAAVEAAVVVLEDCPFLNAGRGSVLCADGTVEMSAAIMCGRSLRAGAVAVVSTARNPIALARAVMERGEHVLLAGPAADRVAAEQGLALLPNDSLITAEQRDRWARGEPGETGAAPLGTVGAVACDSRGDLAAATSTGGVPGQGRGRVSDSASIGAGTYARNGCCAVSCTGTGEQFIRTSAAYDVVARMRYGAASLAQAATAAIEERVAELGGIGGLIAVDGAGRFATPFNAELMYHARAQGESAAQVAAPG